MRTRWMVGAVVAAGLLVAAYVRSQTPVVGSPPPPLAINKLPPSVIEQFSRLEEIKQQRAKLDAEEREILVSVENTLQEVQKALDESRAKLSGYRGGSSCPGGYRTSSTSNTAPPPKPSTPNDEGCCCIPQHRR
jgi:hypothetical protein